MTFSRACVARLSPLARKDYVEQLSSSSSSSSTCAGQSPLRAINDRRILALPSVPRGDRQTLHPEFLIRDSTALQKERSARQAGLCSSIS